MHIPWLWVKGRRVGEFHFNDVRGIPYVIISTQEGSMSMMSEGFLTLYSQHRTVPFYECIREKDINSCKYTANIFQRMRYDGKENRALLWVIALTFLLVISYWKLITMICLVGWGGGAIYSQYSVVMVIQASNTNWHNVKWIIFCPKHISICMISMLSY